MNTLPAVINLSDIEIVEQEPRVKDMVLAKALGFGRARDIRPLIERNLSELERFGIIARHVSRVAKTTATIYHLNERQALYITAKSNTPTAADITVAMVEVFAAWRQGHLQPVELSRNPEQLPTTTTLELDKDTREVLGGILKGIVQKALKELLVTQQHPQPVALPLAARLPNPNLHGVFADVIEMLRSGAAEDRAALMSDMRAWRSDFWFQMKGQIQETDRLTAEVESLRKALHSERSLSGRLAAELAHARQPILESA